MARLRLITSARATAAQLTLRLLNGRACRRHVDAGDDLNIDVRLAAGDVAAVYDAMVEAIGELQAVADRYGDAIGDAESLERVRRVRARCRAIPCDRED
jgi:hypothetical protein